MKKVFIADRIYTLDRPGESFEAMVVENELIKKLTSREEIFQDRSDFSEIIDLRGTILPAFNDAHIHTLGFGSHLEFLDLRGADSIEDIKTKLGNKILTTKKGEWVLGYGWDQELLKEKKYPSRWDLDVVSPDHPVMLSRACHHVAVVNSIGLRIMGLSDSTPDPEGGKFDRSEGMMTGILRETALNFSHMVLEHTFETKVRWLKNAQHYLNSVGITSIQTLDEDNYHLYFYLKNMKDLSLRVYFTPNYEHLETLLTEFPEARTGVGDDNFRWGRVKLYSDGSLGAQTAALREEYEESTDKGILIHSKEKLSEYIKKINNLGWQIETHAIGDLGAEITIEAYKELPKNDNRSILTHCQVLGEDLIKKMADLEIIASIQPVFIFSDMVWAEKFLGKKRCKYAYAWKKLLQNNIKCVGGSDAPIEDPNPLLGIHSAVNRQNKQFRPQNGWYPEEKLSVWEAFRLFSFYSAFSEFQERKKGLLKANYLADFILLDKDPFKVPKTDILQLKVLETYLGAKRVYKLDN